MYTGLNNGRIVMAVRTLSKLIPCSKDTASRALNELELAGFIDVMKIGAFARKERHASEYRLTCFRCDVTGELPSKRFDPRRRHAARSEALGQTVPKFRTDAGRPVQTVPKSRTVEAKSARPPVPKTGTHLESNHIAFSAVKPGPPSLQSAIRPWSTPTVIELPPRQAGRRASAPTIGAEARSPAEHAADATWRHIDAVVAPLSRAPLGSPTVAVSEPGYLGPENSSPATGGRGTWR